MPLQACIQQTRYLKPLTQSPIWSFYSKEPIEISRKTKYYMNSFSPVPSEIGIMYTE